MLTANNQHENRVFKDALNSIGSRIGRKVTRAERRIIHDAISGWGYDFHKIVEIGLDEIGN